MASIMICNLSAESKARLRQHAERRGCSLTALVRSILDRAAERYGDMAAGAERAGRPPQSH